MERGGKNVKKGRKGEKEHDKKVTKLGRKEGSMTTSRKLRKEGKAIRKGEPKGGRKGTVEIRKER